MRILIALTYYRPHYSGLTIYTERQARALAARGHQVTVLTSQYDPGFPLREVVHGVEIIRLPVLMRLSKGVIMPSIPIRSYQLIRRADVVNVHLPQLDAAPISVLARLMGKPVVVTYHCDLRLPRGMIHRIANLTSNVANNVTAIAGNRIVTNTRDYADNSRYLRRYYSKVRIIPPPVVLPQVGHDEVQAFRRKHDVRPGQRIVCMVARLASEKGVEYLVRAMPRVLEKYPQTRVLYAGQHEDVMGEEEYAERLAPLIRELGEHWKFLGVIPDEELAALYRVADAIVLPSTNSTESFGMVQVEAMTCGTPSVVSDIPGLRRPVLTYGMGRVFPVRDAQALAESLIQVLGDPERFKGEVVEIARRYSPETIAAEYEALYRELVEDGEGA